jgi:hypothetical protein
LRLSKNDIAKNDIAEPDLGEEKCAERQAVTDVHFLTGSTTERHASLVFNKACVNSFSRFSIMRPMFLGRWTVVVTIKSRGTQLHG